ncbi:MAG: hypothetical protein NC320_00445 [Clostridium sp.]|nr:hypothetical protein [Clostridium sp.]MCM1546824.1 hypothetical protein [Ruminococcus sp.]
MREKNNVANDRKVKSVISLRKYFLVLKKFFIYWLVVSVIISVYNVSVNIFKSVSTGEVSAIVNFSFDGIESGLDPNGNKFDVNDMKSSNIVTEALEELGYSDMDPEIIRSSISIDGITPDDVIDRITAYTPKYSSDTIDDTSQAVQETSYYPTQYEFKIVCEKADITHKEAAAVLNKIAERYRDTFYSNYGYNTSLEKAVTSIDYTEYDYVDSITVFNTSLRSLQNYINELSANDNTRFRAENGYTFADISASIDTICNENLDWISSYIMINNATKDKENLIANYKFKIEQLNRKKKTAEDTIASISSTIETYEKDSIVILGNATDTSSASLTQSSETYNDLITRKINSQSELSTCNQNIELYTKRLKALESGKVNVANNKTVEQELQKISDKINSLAVTINETASEYYENVLLYNAYIVSSPANASMLALVKSSVKSSIRSIFTFELILTSVYLFVSVILCFVDFPKFINKKRCGKANGSKKK